MYSNKGHGGLSLNYMYVPVGKLKTPAPTIDLTRLNTSSGMVAVPVPLPSSELPSAEPAAATLRAVLATAPAVAGDEGGALAPPLARILATPVALAAGL